MKYLLFCYCLFLAVNASAGSITPMTTFPNNTSTSADDDNYAGIEPEKVVDAQRSLMATIRYMEQNYSTEQFADYAVRLNQSDRRKAIKKGETPPELLSKEILQDKEKIADYLRSRQDWIY
jgi:hypothetical protein